MYLIRSVLLALVGGTARLDDAMEEARFRKCKQASAKMQRGKEADEEAQPRETQRKGWEIEKTRILELEKELICLALYSCPTAELSVYI